jgi:D-alanyl-lipoteichoic acid acyltransferase DltB (MBOAT superfamily)
MLFNSQGFVFVFLPLVVLLQHLLVRRSPRLAIVALAAASYVFYLFGERAYPWLLPASIALNYGFGLLIERQSDPGRRKAALVAGVAADLLILAVFKYADFLIAQAALVTGADLPRPHLVLPVGVSFYTFTQIAYLVDAYRRQRSEGGAASYTLFVSFFPHLIAGPILHHKEMIPQFRRPRVRRLLVSLFPGLVLFAIGLAKKVLVADPLGGVASAVFLPVASHVAPGFFDAWTGLLAYTFQIYFDFSGYSDMALGVALMLGIRLPYNFNSPYKAVSIVAFWRRWHITLSRFLRDYLYIALGGNRRGKAPRQANLFVTMLLGGLWHGAGLTFVIWGALHGAMLLVAHGWSDLARGRPWMRLPAPVGWALTFVCVALAWAPFRSPDLATAVQMWTGAFGGHGFDIPDTGLGRRVAGLLHLRTAAPLFQFADWGPVAAGGLIAFLAPNSQEILRRFRPGLDSPGYGAAPARRGGGLLVAGIDLRTAVAAGALMALAVRAIGGYSEFIYFQF